MYDLVYDIDMELIAFLFTVLLYIETGVCYPKNTKKNKIFRLMTSMVIITEGFDILSAFTNTYVTQLPLGLTMFINSGYFMSGLFLCFMLHYYIRNAVIEPETKSEGNQKLLRFNYAVLIVMEVSVLLNLFFKQYFSFAADGSYVHGSLYLVLHVVSCWFVMCASAEVIANRGKIKKVQFVSSLMFIGVYFIAVFLQTFVVPNILIIMPAASAMLIITIFNLESPDYLELQKTLAELTKTKKELEEANEKYYNMAYTDLMTGLKNRTAYNIRLEQITAMQEKENIIFLIADINNLKKLNDNYGHLVGDDAIVKAGTILKKHFQEGCQCYRIGGDEFAVIAYEMTEEAFLESYKGFIKESKEENEKVSYPFSVAVAYQKIGKRTLLEAMKQADEKMYQDKIKSKAEMK